jgi:hypothetical protein
VSRSTPHLIRADVDDLSYNSAVYASISTNDYAVYLVREAFLSDSPPSVPKSTLPTLPSLWNQSQSNMLDRLEPAECIAEYATALQSHRRNLLLVTDGTPMDLGPLNPRPNYPNNTDLLWNGFFQASDAMNPYTSSYSYGWMCDVIDHQSFAHCADRVTAIKKTPDDWRMGEQAWSVKYCLSEPATPHCRIRFSPVIASIVTALNLCK